MIIVFYILILLLIYTYHKNRKPNSLRQEQILCPTQHRASCFNIKYLKMKIKEIAPTLGNVRALVSHSLTGL